MVIVISQLKVKMAVDLEEKVFYLKEDEVELQSEDGHSYKEIDVIGDASMLSSDGEENLEIAIQNAELSTVDPVATNTAVTDITHNGVTRGEVIEDFIRNFLVKMGLQQTVQSFQTEWYELLVTGKLHDHQRETVPDIYTQNQLLQYQIEELKNQLKGYKEAAQSAKEKYIRLKKERDYHRMHHRRTVQEKERLMTDVKRMKDHFSTYEPMLKGLRNKYEAVTREKLLASLERDKAISEVECLQSTLHSLRPSSYPPSTITRTPLPQRPHPLPPISHSNQSLSQDEAIPNKLHSLPPEPANPYQSSKHPLCAHLSRVGGFQLTGTINAHDYPVSCITLHPTKNIVATGSDDHTWRVWAVPSGELLMTGEGHEDWISEVQFHPSGDLLASCSGDGVVKIWNFSKLSSFITLSDHRQPVWGCSWHWSGDLLASGGMDHTCKLWDVDNGKCVLTLRGHVDSINAVHFLPYVNTVATCSADKTVAMWDVRTGLCLQTIYEHQNACNDVISNYQGTELYSSDCFGDVVCWDIRGKGPMAHWDIGPHPVNSLAIDVAGSVLACASGSGHVSMVERVPGHISHLEGIGGSIEDLCYGHMSDILYSVGEDGKIAVWQ